MSQRLLDEWDSKLVRSPHVRLHDKLVDLVVTVFQHVDQEAVNYRLELVVLVFLLVVMGFHGHSAGLAIVVDIPQYVISYLRGFLFKYFSFALYNLVPLDAVVGDDVEQD